MAIRNLRLILTIAFLLFICCKSASSTGVGVNGLRKLLIQSSNNETFSFAVLSTHENELDTNETWSTTGFQIQNVSTLLSEHSLISRSPPPKNSSRYFCSKNSSASLTILVKSFKQAVMFLNFTYFVGKAAVASESQISPPAPNSTVKVTNKNLSEMPNSLNVMMDSMSTPNLSQQPNTVAVLSDTRRNLVSDLNQSSMSISFPPQDSKVPESVLIKPEAKRKRRSVVLVESKSKSVPASGADSISDNIHTMKDPMATTENTDILKSSESSSVATPLHASDTNLTSTILNSLTLVQAVEMIKTAAAAISKGAVVPNNPALGPVINPPKVDVSHSSFPGQNVGIKNDAQKASLQQSESYSTPSPTLIAITPSNATATSEANIIRETTTEISHQNHHKSRSSKSDRKKRKNMGKKLGDVELNEKDADSGDEDEEDEDDNDNSSSSSSEEKVVDVDLEVPLDKKPKISYKMWRASLEKKNRPPGLYVTVNDDIIFDNWEGIWDKNYVLGKWTGAKALASGKWNQTNVFMNWDAVTGGRDVKITFEWEPVEDFEVILSDIEISTMSSTEMPCVSSEKDEVSAVSNKETGRNDIKKNSTPDITSGNSSAKNEESVFVLRHGKTGQDEWEIVRMDKTKTGQIENAEVNEINKEHDQNGIGIKKENPEDILRAILEKMHTSMHAKSSISNPAISAHTTELSKAEATTVMSAPEIGMEEAEKITVDSSSTPSVKTSIDTTTPNEPITNTAGSKTESTTATSTPMSITSTANATTTAPTTTSSVPTSPVPITLLSSSTIMSTIYKKSSSDSSWNVAGPRASRDNVKPISREIPPRKTDTETALLVSILTGSIAVVILVLTVKKRLDISRKGRNATR